MLFDVRADYGEQHDIAAQNPEVVARMQAAYEDWWRSAVPLMVNENVPFPEEASFWTLYKKQFGTLPGK
jgi:arylsulfatase